jgi:hypothetical protein
VAEFLLDTEGASRLTRAELRAVTSAGQAPSHFKCYHGGVALWGALVAFSWLNSLSLSSAKGSRMLANRTTRQAPTWLCFNAFTSA